VPPYAVTALFEPFRRQPSTERLADSADGSFSRGAGLGLSIVRSVARAHGGEAHAAPRIDGGLIVEIDLPIDLRLDAEAFRAR
jgi:signal transduction histidine kinase